MDHYNNNTFLITDVGYLEEKRYFYIGLTVMQLSIHHKHEKNSNLSLSYKYNVDCHINNYHD